MIGLAISGFGRQWGGMWKASETPQDGIFILGPVVNTTEDFPPLR